MFGFIQAIIDEFKDPEFKGLLVLVLLTLGGGTVIYTVLEGWDLVDAFYFSVVTLTTTGYGDVAPATTTGKLFTVVYLMAGLGLMFAFLRKIAEGATHRGLKKASK